MSVNLLLILFVLIVVAMIAFILVQKGAGATAGSAFGSGASSTVFGAKGSGNFLTKTTMVLAFLFFAISLFMAVNASKEFTTADTGKVDLGVIGELDTSTSDVPSLTPAAGDSTQQESDVPAVDKKATDVPTVEKATNAIKEASSEKASELKDAAVQKATDVKDAAVQKASELKDSALEKASEVKQEVIKKAEEAKDSIDG